eukprot:c15857_g1_i1.p1 GENE.c15857_g1_i1~~c15857_g1_i1.p1  ORF type:complete len:153 (+),score=45.21 c15857_g1_i1:24-461(+)
MRFVHILILFFCFESLMTGVSSSQTISSSNSKEEELKKSLVPSNTTKTEKEEDDSVRLLAKHDFFKETSFCIVYFGVVIIILVILFQIIAPVWEGRASKDNSFYIAPTIVFGFVEYLLVKRGLSFASDEVGSFCNFPISLKAYRN